MKFLLCLFTAMLCVMPTVMGQTPPPPKAPKKTDSTFVIKAGESDPNIGEPDKLGTDVKAGGSVTFKLNIDRVVGATDGQGRLSAPSSLIANGVIKDFATLKIAAFDIDRDNEDGPNCQPREFDEVVLNGQKIGANSTSVYLNGKNRKWRITTFKVPVGLLNFGVYVNSQWQMAGTNNFDINVSTKAPSKFTCGNNDITWTARVQWAAVSFEALYPIVMIHGTESDGASWDTTNFTRPFRDMGIPYDNSITMASNRIERHGNELRDSIPAIAKDRFHVKHVHLVAHSQGGLDSRDFLGRTIPKGDISVLTLTALCTPNKGSPGADYADDARSASYLFLASSARAAAVRLFAPYSLATPTLRVTYVMGIFNPANALPDTLEVDGQKNSVKYSVIGADADNIVHNRVIEAGESAGFPTPTGFPVLGNSPRTAQQAYDLIGGVAYTTTGTVTRFGLAYTFITEIPNTDSQGRPIFLRNDFLVSETSFQHPKFTYLGLRPLHHITIRNPDIASEVIVIIKANNKI